MDSIRKQTICSFKTGRDFEYALCRLQFLRKRFFVPRVEDTRTNFLVDELIDPRAVQFKLRMSVQQFDEPVGMFQRHGFFVAEGPLETTGESSSGILLMKSIGNKDGIVFCLDRKSTRLNSS